VSVTVISLPLAKKLTQPIFSPQAKELPPVITPVAAKTLTKPKSNKNPIVKTNTNIFFIFK